MSASNGGMLPPSAISTHGWEPSRRRACIALLGRVKARIEDPGHHAIGAFARDADGIECTPRAPEASSWCFTGAVYAEPLPEHGANESHIDAWVAIQELIDPRDVPETCVSEVNDGPLGHRRILALIDEACSRLRAGGAS